MHGNQWVLKIAVLKYYSVSKRGTTAKSNPKQATDPISLHTKFGDNSSNTFPLNERKPCVTPDIGRRTPDIGHRTAKKAKIIYPPPRGVDITNSESETNVFTRELCAEDLLHGESPSWRCFFPVPWPAGIMEPIKSKLVSILMLKLVSLNNDTEFVLLHSEVKVKYKQTFNIRSEISDISQTIRNQ